MLSSSFLHRMGVALGSGAAAQEFNGIVGAIQDLKRGKTYYVDTNNGNDNSNGLSWDAAFETMESTP